MVDRERPLVAVIADRRMLGEHAYHLAGEKYLQALIKGAGVYPAVLPAMVEDIDIASVLARFDGLFLTGSPSNVEPHHYQGNPSKPGTWHDPQRDENALALIPATLRAGMPLFAVCRGFQEMNVSLGGSLHQLIHEVPGFGMHKENPEDSLQDQWAPAHAVAFTRGGLLESITGVQRTSVNSLHSQAVDRLAQGLQVEAVADDGLVEAFTLKDTPGWNLSVQWHPEWEVTQHPVSLSVFRAFGDACRNYAASMDHL